MRKSKSISVRKFKNTENKNKGISIIITSVLLVLISVVIVFSILSVSSTQSKENLGRIDSTINNSTETSETKKDVTTVIVDSGDNSLIIKNTDQVNDYDIVGYKIITEDPNDYPFFNSYQELDSPVRFSSGGSMSEVEIACVPDDESFIIEFTTDTGEVISKDIKSTLIKERSVSCAQYYCDNYDCPDGIIRFQKSYGDTLDDKGWVILRTIDNGYIFGGYTTSFGAGNADFWLLKADENGNEDWNKTYGGIGAEYIHSIIQTSDGGYALLGYTFSYGAGSSDIWLVKTNSLGIVDWNKTYGGTNSDLSYSVIQTSDNGYAIFGQTISYGTAGDYDVWLIKTNSLGVADWNITYGGVNTDDGLKIIQTNDGGFALLGSTNSYGAVNGDILLIKVNSSGVVDWNKTYGGTNSDEGRSIVLTSDGGYAILGRTASYGAGSLDFLLIKINSSGIIDWNKTYGGINSEWSSSLILTSDGGYAMLGNTYSYGAGNLDFWLVKTNSLGIVDWNKTYGGTNLDSGTDIIQTDDNGFALLGYTRSFGNGDYDFWLIKTDSDGNYE
ncbi:MAG: hypothetical protein V1824_03840 [archaeon]